MNKKWSIDYATSNDGTKIRFGLFSDQSIHNKKLSIVFCNGRSEWIEKYKQLPLDLNIANSALFLTLDHRGQGGSAGFPFHIDSYETYVQDLKNVIELAFSDTTQSINYGVLAHSMGGLIALFATLQGYIKPQFLILCSPLLELPDDPFGHRINCLLAQFLTTIGLGKTRTGAAKALHFEDNLLTQSKARFEELIASPHQSKRPTFAWVYATYKAIEIIQSPKYLAQLNMPILVLGGTEEKLLNYSSFKNWAEKANKHAKAKIVYKDIASGRHELLFEKENIYQATLAEIEKFMTPILLP
ncbi:MAG: alpha/beta hydrolase [Oligoflexales bacterium]|nr:alpha/beta hydrolase [Oligoflexales bacterium]